MPALVFLDVDGVLIPFRDRQGAASAARGATGAAVAGGGNPLLVRLDPDDGRRLLALRCQLVWATTWGGEANEVVAPRLGLPTLPVVDWPDADEDPPPGLHWKTVLLTRWAARRPFVWLDDEITSADRRWAAAHHPAPALLHRVDPFEGLTEASFATVRRFLGERQHY